MNAVVSAPVIKGRLGILAGRGNYPVLVAHAARDLAHDPYIFAIKDEADQDWSGYDATVVGLGDLSTFIQIVRREDIGAVVMAGGISRRPGIRDIRPTWTSIRSAPRALRALLSGGDDGILRAAVQMLERHGVRVLGAHEIAPDLLGQTGPLGECEPDRADQRDISAAAEAAIALGRLDVGQGAVAVGGRVVALEGLEGTDAMLARVAGLRAEGRLRSRSRGVLVKLSKPGQELRTDLPAIGPATVRNAHAAGLSGIAIEAGRSLVLDRAEVIDVANRLGLFVTGLDLTAKAPST